MCIHVCYMSVFMDICTFVGRHVYMYIHTHFIHACMHMYEISLLDMILYSTLPYPLGFSGAVHGLIVKILIK